VNASPDSSAVRVALWRADGLQVAGGGGILLART
jgi:hypothetical protein